MKTTSDVPLEAIDVTGKLVLIEFTPETLCRQEMDNIDWMLYKAGARQVIFHPPGLKLQTLETKELEKLGLTWLHKSPHSERSDLN